MSLDAREYQGVDACDCGAAQHGCRIGRCDAKGCETAICPACSRKCANADSCGLFCDMHVVDIGDDEALCFACMAIDLAADQLVIDEARVA